MSLHQTTPVPNRLFDLDLVSLKEVEIKVLLIVIRKTHGWVDSQNPRQRKQFARIPIAAFVMNTGCSKRGVSSAIDSLSQKGLISVLDENGTRLSTPEERKGKYHMYFKPTLPPVEKLQYRKPTQAKFALNPAQNLRYTYKEREQKKREGKKPEYFESHGPLHITRFLDKYTV